MTKKNKKVNKYFVRIADKNSSGWGTAIEAAERELLRAEVRGRELRGVIRLFKEKMKSGEAWPGESTSDPVQ